MEAKELRIGNYVEELGDVVIVGLATFIHYDDMPSLMNRSIQPIPLTEEWLLKFNVLRDYDGLFILSDNLKLSLGTDNVKIFLNGIYHIHTIKSFVHILQNLYFALKNEELTIKP